MKPEVPEIYPETPAWTMFFDGPLYQRYEEFMRGKDFSKILLTSKLKLANSQELDVKSEEVPKHEEWWETEIDLDKEKVANPNIYTSVSEEYYRNLKDDRKRVKRRTRAFIVLGMVILAALAFGTAMVIHYFFIPPDDDPPSSDVNISLTENISATQTDIQGITTTVLPTKIDQDISKDLTNLLNKFIPKDGHDDKSRAKPDSKSTASKHDHQTTSNVKTSATTAAPIISFLDLYDLFGVDDFSTTHLKHIRSSTTTDAQGTKETTPVDTTQSTTTETSTKITLPPTEMRVETTFPTYIYTSATSLTTDTKSEKTSSTQSTTTDSQSTVSRTQSSSFKTSTLRDDAATVTDSGVWDYDDYNTTTSTSELSSSDISSTSASTAVGENTTSSHPLTRTTTTQITTRDAANESTTGFTTAWHDITRDVTTTTTSVDQKTTYEILHVSTLGAETTTEQPNTTTVDIGPITTADAFGTSSTSNKTTSSFQTSTTISDSSSTAEVTSTTEATNTTTTSITVESTTTTPGTSTHGLPTTTPTKPVATTAIQSPTTTPTAQHSTTTTTMFQATTAGSESPTTTIDSFTTTAQLPTATSSQSSESLTTTVTMQTTTATTEKPETTTRLSTTTSTVQTTLPEQYNMLKMKPATAYTGETSSINCNATFAVRWTYLTLRTKSTWMPLQVKLYSDGRTEWSSALADRHLVKFDINSDDGFGTNITVDLIIYNVRCEDSQTFICILETEESRHIEHSELIVAGKPGSKVRLKLGPAIIEGKALRLTATWSAGYPRPWTNISWLAVDNNNKTYNLERFGQYREYDLQTDHHRCETVLTTSFVIFPTMDLNATTVTVAPDLSQSRHFIDNDMKHLLQNVKPGSEEILVIPLDYCKNGNKETAIPHPFTECSKYIRCLPNDIIVQQCPGGTCFYEGLLECV